MIWRFGKTRASLFACLFACFFGGLLLHKATYTDVFLYDFDYQNAATVFKSRALLQKSGEQLITKSKHSVWTYKKKISRIFVDTAHKSKYPTREKVPTWPVTDLHTM